MELRSKFLPQFRVWQQRQLYCVLSSKRTKRDSLIIGDMFSREAPAQYYRWKNLGVHCNIDPSIRQLALSENESFKLPELSFNRLQLTEQECAGMQKRNFGRFVAREAVLDEEYWTAAWLRAEAHWESVCYMRHIDSYKRKYAEQEFYALKRRCFAQEGNSLNCFCFVAEKKRPSSVLATQEPFDAHKYAYIANVCVAKFARHQGIASNMLYLATDVAQMLGMTQLFVHVNADNQPACDLYLKTGFKVFEPAAPPLSKDQRILMSMEL